MGLADLLGLAAITIGLVLFGASAMLNKVLSGWSRPIPFLMAALLIFWVFSLIVGLEDWGDAGKALVGLGWVLLGVALLFGKTSPGREIAHGAVTAPKRAVKANSATH